MAVKKGRSMGVRSQPCNSSTDVTSYTNYDFINPCFTNPNHQELQMNNDANNNAAPASPEAIAAATNTGAAAINSGAVEKVTVQLGNDRIELSKPRERMKLLGAFGLGGIVTAAGLWGAKRWLGFSL